MHIYCHISGMSTLKELDLSRCSKVTDAGIRHLLSIPTLEELCISETGVTTNGVTLLSSLKNLSMLDLGGLHITDLVLGSLQVYYFIFPDCLHQLASFIFSDVPPFLLKCSFYVIACAVFLCFSCIPL